MSRRPSTAEAASALSDEESLRLELRRLRKINASLVERVERSMDQQGNAFTLFQTAINLEGQIRKRTEELTNTLADLERSNQELRIARDRAVQINRSKTRFLAAASHDVLQPLNAALLLISSLNAVQDSAEGERLCGQVERSLDTMDSLLRTLLYISRLDAGDVQPRFQSVSVDELFDSIASDFEPMARQRDLELRVRHSGLRVRSDALMLRRILQNLVTNALRYTREGGVLLIAGSRGGTVHVRIADTGIGIERERFQDIFVEFSRGGQQDDRDDDTSAGLGLGLAIVERMVSTLGHRITLNSRVGHGSCFSLMLPRVHEVPVERRLDTVGDGTVMTHRGAPANRFAGLQGARILVIENDRIALEALESLLRQWGCDLRTCSSTGEALQALAADGWHPDIILADQHLDDSDRGTTAIRAVRERLEQIVPALVMTANPSDAIWRLVEQGELDVMPKPIKPARLRAFLTHLHGQGSTEDKASAANTR